MNAMKTMLIYRSFILKSIPNNFKVSFLKRYEQRKDKYIRYSAVVSDGSDSVAP